MNTVQEFAKHMEAERMRGLIEMGYTPAHHNVKVAVHVGKKYTRVDVGDSGCYMVVNETGEIFGIKAYGVIHKGHAYGTLDTMLEWDWSDYKGVKKQAVQV